jgi:hypothetical protein
VTHTGKKRKNNQTAESPGLTHEAHTSEV